MAEHDLKSLYREAQSALKSRDYARASDLLKQILLIDENYKDASRLLAQTVKLRRRRWYNHPLLWGTVAIAALVAIGMLAPRIRGLYARQPSATAITTNSPTFTVAPTAIVTATETPLSAPTPVPLTWKRVSLGQEFERDTVTAFVIDPRDPDVLYAGMKNAGIYKSIDGGLSWHPSHRGISSTQVVSILIDFKAPNIVYAGTKGGIFKTEDGGENWAQIGEGTHVLIDPMDNSHLYTRDADNIYESTDWGKTWEAVYSSQVGCPGKIFAWAIHPTDGSTLFISAGEAECEPGIYQSDDGGRTWTLIQKSEIPPGYEWDWASYLVGEMGWLLVQIEDGNIVIDYGPLSETPPVAGFVYSRCWEPFLPFLCKYSPTGKQPYNLFASGVVRLGKPDVWPHNTEGGTSYELAMTGWTITISPHDPDTIYVAGEGIAVTKDGGLTWTKLNKGLGNTILDLAAGLGNERTLFLLPGKCKGELTNGGHDLTQSLYLSTNGGSAWDFVTETGCYLIMDVNGATMYRISTNYWWTGEALMGWLWRSQDGGRSWRRILIPRAIETIVVHASQTGHLYGFAQAAFYKTNINPDYQEKWYYYSEDFGNTWNEQEATAHAKLCYGSTLQFIDAYHPMSIDPGDGDHVFVIDDGILLESHDSCETTGVFATAPNTNMNSIAFDPNQSSTIYVGTDSGAFISFDGGQTWNEINDGLLGATVVYSIVVDKDSNVYAATPYGIFKLEGSNDN